MSDLHRNKTMSRGALALFGLAALALSACGSTASFGLSSGDNDPAKLEAAFAKAEAPSAGPTNRMGKPMLFLVARGKTRQVVAFDLNAKAELWRTDSEISSKVVVGSDFIAYKEGESSLVGRDVESGAKLWSVDLDGTFVGAAADRERVYLTVKSGSREWLVRAINGKTGAEIWKAESDGALGAPAARGGLVFSPYLKQWLAIIDGRDGSQLTRIRGIDEEISFVRTTAKDVFFGSKSGVFLLDKRAASGKRAQSTYGAAKLPENFIRVHYHWDAFDPVQAGYSAYDRNRVLWEGAANGDALGFTNDLVTVQTYRFFFGFSASTGELKWAYNHPRVDVVASSEVGGTIGIASMSGEIGALNPATGERVYEATIKGQFIGGTFDAAGWAPSESSAPTGGTAAALASIARDRDARFNDVKKFAVTALSQLKGGDVSRDLLTLIQNEKTPPYLVQTAADVLVERSDVAGLPYLVEALGTHHDYIEGTKPRAVGISARAIAALDAEGIAPALRGKAVEGLLAHLEAPETAPGDLVHLVRALGKVGAGTEMKPLTSFLLVYRADPAFATQIDAVAATVDVLLNKGGTAEREVIAFVAEDPSSQSGVAEYAKRALLQRPVVAPDTNKGPDTKKGPGTKKQAKPDSKKIGQPIDTGKAPKKAQKPSGKPAK